MGYHIRSRDASLILWKSDEDLLDDHIDIIVGVAEHARGGFLVAQSVVVLQACYEPEPPSAGLLAGQGEEASEQG